MKTKNLKNPEQGFTTLAELRLINSAEWSDRQRARMVKWLWDQADLLFTAGGNYGGDYCARYLQREPNRKKA